MPSQRPHDMFQALTYQHDLIASLKAFSKSLDSINFQIWLEFVLEIFLAQ
jgi:hypothetical protein